MHYLLSAVKLKPGESPETFAQTVAQLTDYLHSAELISGASAVGERYRHPIMDTDKDDLDFFFTISFETRQQLDASVDYMTGRSGTGAQLHEQLWSQLAQYRFTCWED